MSPIKRYILYIQLSIAPIFTQDTFSIVAINLETGEVGSAGASCIGGSIIISEVHPGVGAIHTQSYWNATNQNNASEMMDNGYSPTEIIEYLVDNDAQNNSSIRQYGIVDLFDNGRSAAFTGDNCFNYKSHITAPTYSIQGNILLGQEVLDSMEVRFLNTTGSLAIRLMASMQGAKIPGADTRCLDDGISSLSAFIRVAKPENSEADLYLHLNVNNTTAGVDPIDTLQDLFDEWYLDNPDYTIGDINSDGIINVQDIIIEVNFILEFMVPDMIQMLAGDLNEDEIIDILDIILIVGIILNN